MATFTSAHDLARYQKARADAFRRAQGQVTQQEADRLVARMNTRIAGLLSGTRTTRELALMGHPYRRQRQRLTGNQRLARQSLRAVRLLPINRQSGRLKEGTRAYAVIRKVGNHHYLTLRLRSNVPYALYQLDPEGKGTRTLKPRGFWRALQVSYAKYDAGQIRNARLKASRAANRLLRS